MSPNNVTRNQQRQLEFADIFGDRCIGVHPVFNIRWRDHEHLTYAQRDGNGSINIRAYDIRTGEHSLMVAGSDLTVDGATVPIMSYEWALGGRYLLLAGPAATTWDGQQEAPYYVLDWELFHSEEAGAEQGSLRGVSAPGLPLRNAWLSPDGARVGYSFGNNLYIALLADLVEQAVTRDGDSNIFNGVFDYGSSEFTLPRTWKWSPDGQCLAFWRLDATQVPEYAMVDELGDYPQVRNMKYPNVAQHHAVARIGVFDVGSHNTKWMDTGSNPDDYLPQLDWADRSRALLIQRLARNHQRLDLLLADSRTGASKVIYSETDPAWIDVTEDLQVNAAGDRFVWTSERSGYRHAYVFDLTGIYRQLTDGDWEISSILSWDEPGDWLYFYAKKDGFVDQHVYRVQLDGLKQEKLSRESGWHEWLLSSDARYAIATYSNISTPRRVNLVETDGSIVREIDAGCTADLAEFDLPTPELVSFETSDGISLDAYIIKPVDFDANKSYPVISYAYGNAGSQVVSNQWGTGDRVDRFLWHLRQAQRGYIVFCADNRTTAGRGKQAKNLTYGYYAKFAVSDQLETARYLKTLPFVDATRLGFWGWSGGAYLACAVMTKGAPTFKVGVSVAPVIDLSRYQAVGVERWMGLLSDNPVGYHETNLLNFADKMQGKLLLIHGTGDENVKPAYTLQFADALITAGKQFDMMIYPNEHHALGGVKAHAYTKIQDYFDDHL